MNRSTSLRILENKFVTLEQAGFCGVPGYLILRVRTGAESFGDLSTPSSQRLGGILASAAAAIGPTPFIGSQRRNVRFIPSPP